MRVRTQGQEVTKGQEVSAVRVIWAPSMVRKVLRNRAVWLLVAIAVGVAGSVMLASQLAAVEQQRSSWGAGDRVPVVTEAVEIGELLAGKIEFQEWPQAVVPPSVLSSVTADARAKMPLYRGEVVLAQRVTTGSDRLPPGTGALTLPVLARVSLIDIGDLVDLWSVDGATLSSHRVATHVVVLAIEDDSITVAIRDGDIADATVAALRPITVVLAG